MGPFIASEASQVPTGVGLPGECCVTLSVRIDPVLLCGRLGQTEGSNQAHQRAEEASWPQRVTFLCPPTPCRWGGGGKGLKFRTPLTRSLPSIMVTHLYPEQEERRIYGDVSDKINKEKDASVRIWSLCLVLCLVLKSLCRLSPCDCLPCS